MTYSKEICISNIRHLAKINNLKLGDVESRAGVSVGYFSKLLNSTADPSIETLSKLSDLFKISIDYITSVDIERMNETEIKVLNFLEKLISETNKDNYLWNKESKNFLNSISIDDEFESKNMFCVKEVPIETYNGTETVEQVMFDSEGRDENDYRIVDDCYNCKLSNDNKIFIMKIQKIDSFSKFINMIDTEIYVEKNNKKALLCRKIHGEEASLDDIIDRTYLVAKESSKKIKLNETAKSVIDDFMN